MKIALGLSYEGSNYQGWQRQRSGVTIQSLLEAALSRVADQPITVICAGRTDQGVHALGQVVHFETEALRSEHAWLSGTNTYLPADIRVRWAHQVPLEFHARFSALARSYTYLLYQDKVKPALWHRQITWSPYVLQIEPMQEAAQFFLGEHDFSSFRAASCQSHSPIREVQSLSVQAEYSLIRIYIKANAFLHHMVRNIVGVLLRIGRLEQPASWAQAVLAARDRRAADLTAPPQGLYLTEVFYPDHFNLPLIKEPFLLDLFSLVTRE